MRIQDLSTALQRVQEWKACEVFSPCAVVLSAAWVGGCRVVGGGWGGPSSQGSGRSHWGLPAAARELPAAAPRMLRDARR